MNLLLFKTQNQPAVDFSFLTGSLPQNLAFARASTGTRVNANGVLENMDLNAPRFDYAPTTLAPLGLLNEEQRANILTYSKVGPSWPRDLSLTENTTDVLSPEGLSTATKLTEVTSAVVQRTYRTAGQAVVGGQAYSFSVFFKAGTASIAQLTTGSGTSLTAFANFDLSNGTITAQAGLSAASIRPMANGWYRCTIALTSIADGVTPVFMITHCDNNPTGARQMNYAGTGRSFYAWGAQIEKGAMPSSYIPTTSAVVTRAADQLSLPVPENVPVLRCVFDDNSTQDIPATAGTFTLPTPLNGSILKRIYSTV